MEILEVTDNKEKSAICRSIISKLKEWFALPIQNEIYAENVQKYDFLKICLQDQVIGFISLKQNSEIVSELYVLGILKEYQGKGYGTRALEYVFEHLRNKNIQYLEVKTLADSKESVDYDRTRQFYTKLGFFPLDVLENEWGKDDPCLIMLKKL